MIAVMLVVIRFVLETIGLTCVMLVLGYTAKVLWDRRP